MAEFLPLLGSFLGGGGGGGIGTAIGDALRAIARVLSALARTLGRAFDKIAGALRHFVTRLISIGSKIIHLLIRFFRFLGHYIMVLFRYTARVMTNFYREFQKDPLTSVQFIGTVAILINSGL